MMKYKVRFQNQSTIIKKKSKSYSKFHKLIKPIPDNGRLRPESVLSFCGILNKKCVRDCPYVDKMKLLIANQS